jgi:hypothetical protein
MSLPADGKQFLNKSAYFLLTLRYFSWRRLPFYVDGNSLADYWTCSMNTWDPENASCSAPQDTYNPEKESTIAYQADERQAADFEIGTWKDVFCVHNHIYYEAQIKAKRKPIDSELEEVKFHFKGWSTCFDEWIDIDSDRIQPHHLYTNPDAVRFSEQEKWQGMKRMTTTKTVAVKPKKVKAAEPKKRKSTGSSNAEGEAKQKKAKQIEKNEAPAIVTARHSYPEYMYADDFALSDDEDHKISSSSIDSSTVIDSSSSLADPAPQLMTKVEVDDTASPVYWTES